MKVVGIAQIVEKSLTAKGGNRFDVLITSGLEGIKATMFAPAGNDSFMGIIGPIIDSRKQHVFDLEVGVYNNNPQYTFTRIPIVLYPELQVANSVSQPDLPKQPSSLFPGKTGAGA